MPQPPDPNQNIEETKNTPDKEGVVEPRQHSSQNSINPIIPPDQNIEQQDNSIIGCCAGGTYRHEVCSHVKEYIAQQVSEARIAELKAVMKETETGDVSIWVYKWAKNRIAELKQTPPTPNGDEQGGLERPSDEK